MNQIITTQSITKEYNGRTYTTGETWKSNVSYPSTMSGVIVGFTKEGKPIIEMERGGIDVLLNPNWVKVQKTKYYVYRNPDGRLCVLDNSNKYLEVVKIVHEFTLEE